MEIKTKLCKNQYEFSKDSETHLLITLQAPKINFENRAPICVLPVCDVSGSMAGSKIDYLRKACRKLVEHLAPGDFMGIVAFDSNVYEIAPIREITQEQKEVLKKEISKLNVGSATNLSGGLLRALQMVNKMDLPSNTILRVIVFTDGQANVGLKGEALLNMAIEKKERVSVSAFGFGTDCSQEILADISSKCDGNYAYIDSPDAALTAFARELGGLMAVFGQDIKVSIKPDKNNKILEILNDEDVIDDNGTITIKLRDILSQEQKFLVAKVLLNKVEKPLPRKVNAFSINVSYTDTNGDEKILECENIKVQFCKVGEEPVSGDEEVIRNRDRLTVAKAQNQAEFYARAGNWVGAKNVMLDCCDSLESADIRGVAENLTANYSSSSDYTASSGITNSTRALFSGRRLSNKVVGTNYSIAGGQDFSYMDDMEEEFKKDEKTDKPITTNIPLTITFTNKKKSGKDW